MAALGREDRIVCDCDVQREYRAWGAVAAEIIHHPVLTPFEFGFAGNAHFLAVCDTASRADGETSIDGLVPSRRRALGGSMVLVPSGSKLQGWSVPKQKPAWLYLYIGPSLAASSEGRAARHELAPRLHFNDLSVRATVTKFRQLLEHGEHKARLYAETLGALLMMELEHATAGEVRDVAPNTGGLSARHQRVLCDFIESHFAEDISLHRLAALVGLNPFHMARSFKRSLGIPPHAFVNRLRVDKAKDLIASRQGSMTEVALTVGFSSPSHFATTFRRITGRTPTEFRRALD